MFDAEEEGARILDILLGVSFASLVGLSEEEHTALTRLRSCWDLRRSRNCVFEGVGFRRMASRRKRSRDRSVFSALWLLSGGCSVVWLSVIVILCQVTATARVSLSMSGVRGGSIRVGKCAWECGHEAPLSTSEIGCPA